MRKLQFAFREHGPRDDHDVCPLARDGRLLVLDGVDGDATNPLACFSAPVGHDAARADNQGRCELGHVPLDTGQNFNGLARAWGVCNQHVVVMLGQEIDILLLKGPESQGWHMALRDGSRSGQHVCATVP